jgi:hypothetical protein
MVLYILLLWLLMCLVDWYFGTIRKCLDNIGQRVRILVARQVGRRPSRRCNTRLELFLLRSLRVTLSFRFVVQRWSGSHL